MKQVILYTSFILTCVKQKIDFFNEIELMGILILIPRQVIDELKRISLQNSQVVLKMLKKKKFQEIDLKTKDVDLGIIKFAKKNKNTIVATLDREIKSKTQNQKIVIRGKKRLEII